MRRESFDNQRTPVITKGGEGEKGERLRSEGYYKQRASVITKEGKRGGGREVEIWESNAVKLLAGLFYQ